MSNRKVVVFDLDDTLLNEIDYLKSAFLEIALFVDSENKLLYSQMLGWYENKDNVFDKIIEIYPNQVLEQLIFNYRNHIPTIQFTEETINLLKDLKKQNCILGIISDGRSITQRNKLLNAGQFDLWDKVIISEEFGSEKPCEENYKEFDVFGKADYYYIADNTKKDFIAPNKLGWTTVCLLDSGINIHKQNFDLHLDFLPKFKIKRLCEVKKIILS